LYARSGGLNVSRRSRQGGRPPWSESWSAQATARQVVVDPATAGQVRQGRDFHVSPFRAGQGTRYVRALSGDGDLLAIGEAKLPNIYHPVVVL